MAYSSKGKKPMEWASKINHTHIINDEHIKQYIQDCKLPKDANEIELDKPFYKEHLKLKGEF